MKKLFSIFLIIMCMQCHAFSSLQRGDKIEQSIIPPAPLHLKRGLVNKRAPSFKKYFIKIVMAAFFGAGLIHFFIPKNKEKDSGVTEEDSGVTEEDSGVTEEDSGATEEDSGATEEDSGATEEDSGATEEDSGATEEDFRAHVIFSEIPAEGLSSEEFEKIKSRMQAECGKGSFNIILNLSDCKSGLLNDAEFQMFLRGLERCQGLWSLDISGNELGDERFSLLIESLAKIKGFRDLSCKENGITKVPGSIRNIENLRDLRLDNNDLKEIPPQVVHIKKLELLNLNHCKISSLPYDLGRFEKLQFLLLENNKLNMLNLDSLLSKLEPYERFRIQNFETERKELVYQAIKRFIEVTVPQNCRIYLSGNGLPWWLGKELEPRPIYVRD